MLVIHHYSKYSLAIKKIDKNSISSRSVSLDASKAFMFSLQPFNCGTTATVDGSEILHHLGCIQTGPK